MNVPFATCTGKSRQAGPAVSDLESRLGRLTHTHSEPAPLVSDSAAEGTKCTVRRSHKISAADLGTNGSQDLTKTKTKHSAQRIRHATDGVLRLIAGDTSLGSAKGC